MAFDLLEPARMTVPVRSFSEPAISVVDPRSDSNRPIDAHTIEPEPRQTTPSMVKLATPRPRRWLAAVSAVALVLGATGIANVFAQAEIAIEAR